MQTKELIPGGSQIAVANDNVNLYIHRYAHFKLNLEIAEQSKAFLSGFRDLIPLAWIRMFNANELKLLISGDHESIDMADLRRNVHYAGGYADSQPYIQEFWSVVGSFSPKEQSDFLMFVTSVPRQPLLGFGSLNPKFGIYRVPADESEHSSGKLPTAATCMNLLKLPQYSSTEVLREKLLYAIGSNSGFELS